MVCYPNTDAVSSLKSDLIGQWIEREWLPPRAGQDLLTLWASPSVIREDVLLDWNADFDLLGYRFAGIEAVQAVSCDIVPRLTSKDWEGVLTHRTGANLYRFEQEGGAPVEVLVIGAHYQDMIWYMVAFAALPRLFVPVWHAFERECDRLASAIEPDNEVIIVGGNSNAFVPTVEWSDVILPDKLKADILDDVQSFFTKGIDIYKRLNLKPFRKLLLAGVPGTGKTMICSALAKWALAQKYVVIYVSSAHKKPNEAYGSTFEKIQEALSIAANSQHPALILLEELDAYLHAEEKALVLNVLDGSESSINDRGTLLVSTTNYPEAIDERVLKRPGRLDRIFIIPETREAIDAEAMLRKYLGVVWRDEHAALVPHLVGYPGAFIREVAIHALTQMAYDDLAELSYTLLEASFKGLKDQIDARDDFLRKRPTMQLVPSNGRQA